MKKEKTIHSESYKRLIASLIALRHKRQLTQRELESKLKVKHPYIAKVEIRERRLDIIEFLDIMAALDVPMKDICKLLEDLRK